MGVETKITRYPLTPCPWCLKGLDAASAVGSDDAVPNEGDVTLCIECGEWCLFNADLTLRKPTDDELTEIALDRRYQIAREFWVDAQEEKTGLAKLRADTKTVLRVVTTLTDVESEQLTVLAFALVTICKTRGISRETLLFNVKDMFSTMVGDDGHDHR